MEGIADRIGVESLREMLRSGVLQQGSKGVRYVRAQSQSPARATGRRVASHGESEDELQILCFRWIEAHAARWPVLQWTFHCPNGGKRTKAQAGRFKAMGVKSGVVDVINQMPHQGWTGLAIELKVGRNRPTCDQQAYLDEVARRGGVTAVCRSLEEFEQAMRRYLHGRLE